MGSVADFLKHLVKPRPKMSREQVMKAFKRRYGSFKQLLQANTDMAATLGRLEAALRGDRQMDMNQLQVEALLAFMNAKRMVLCLNNISGNRYRALDQALASISERIECELEDRESPDVKELVFPLDKVDARMAHSVGGKNANLGEVRNNVGMPVPPGFAISTLACAAFLEQNGLHELIVSATGGLDLEAPAGIAEASRQITAAISTAPVPEELASALLAAWDAHFSPDDAVALRSSAVDEDGNQSFAGQYITILGVHRDTLLSAFKEVLTGLYSARALAYRMRNGFVLVTSSMGMCCIKMVNAVAAGVAFSRHPVDLHSNAVVINASWGLGESVVDGMVTPDTWLVRRATMRITEATLGTKTHEIRLGMTAQGSLYTERVALPPEKQQAFCLSQEQVRKIARMALALEDHYHRPQDLEWVLDENNEIILLQTRPILLSDGRYMHLSVGRIDDAELLMEGGEVAARGIGCGPVVHTAPDDDMSDFPTGGVMLLPHPTTNIMLAIERAAAIVTQTGSLTGHMASICREFNVPTLMNLPGVLDRLKEGETITVDAMHGRIYAGEVPGLLALQAKEKAQRKASVSPIVRRVADHILPLRLVDPKSEMFAPEHCTTLHDVMRLAHEKSYNEMFLLSDIASSASTAASELRCSVPLDLHVIDLGGGLKDPERPVVYPEEVISLPFKTLLDGMLSPEVQVRGPRPVNMRGFMAVMRSSMVGANHTAVERFGDRSYAIISDKYFNFSSRVGYHYAVMDCWCSETMSKNYITFHFAGGAADDVRRERRVRCIGLILKQMGFNVSIVGDSMQGRFVKYPKEILLSRLDQLGKLLIVTRQMDMLMTTEAMVAQFAENFHKGIYH